MTVSGIEALGAPAHPDAARTGAPNVERGDFAAVLAEHQGGATVSRPGSLATVSLDQMLSSFAGTPSVSTGEPMEVRGAADAWGVAADRPSSALTGSGAAVLAAGERYLGVPYKWGGTDPEKGFDCSGFVQRVYQDLGISLPRVSADQARAGVEVAGGMDAAEPGDLVFWSGSGSRPNHIGIYAGEGRMLVAPRTGDVVRYQEITRTPDAVRRVIG